jgi:hypothetical protein
MAGAADVGEPRRDVARGDHRLREALRREAQCGEAMRVEYDSNLTRTPALEIDARHTGHARQARLVDGASEVHKMVLARFLAAERTEFWAWR